MDDITEQPDYSETCRALVGVTREILTELRVINTRLERAEALLNSPAVKLAARFRGIPGVTR